MGRSKSRRDTINKYLLSLAIGAILIFLLISTSPKRVVVIVPEDVFHVHADFKVFINDKELDFSLPEYDVRNSRIHLHTDNDFGGNVIHIEEENATLGGFFDSLGMIFNSTCFVTPEGFCNKDNNKLQFYVNGLQNDEYGNYSPKDLDKILISYGNGDIDKQLNSITKLACAFSNKCRVPSGVRVVTL